MGCCPGDRLRPEVGLVESGTEEGGKTQAGMPGTLEVEGPR